MVSSSRVRRIIVVLGADETSSLNPLVDLHELRQGLHRKQERGVRSTRGLQDLRKVAIAEWRKLVQHDTEHWPVRAQPMLFAFVPLADDQLQILQKHLSQ